MSMLRAWERLCNYYAEPKKATNLQAGVSTKKHFDSPHTYLAEVELLVSSSSKWYNRWRDISIGYNALPATEK